MSFTVTKLSGTGNTFLFVDARTREQNDAIFAFFNTRSRSQIAKIICDPYHSVGADGLAFVENSVGKVNNSRLKWDFYNADGSSAEMCGNASRCFALYAKKIGVADNPLRFESKAGVIEVSSVENGDFEVVMPQLSQLKLKQKIGKINYTFVNSGVPHAVIETKFSLLQLSEKQLAQLAAIDSVLKKHSRFKPSSTNVTFYYVKQAGKLESLTFERGVRGYTQACGTGAVAAAAAYKYTTKIAKKFASQSVRLHLPGGNVTVKLLDDRPHLIGPAKVIADITPEL